MAKNTFRFQRSLRPAKGTGERLSEAEAMDNPWATWMEGRVLGGSSQLVSA